MKITKTDGKFEATIGGTILPKNPNDMSMDETADWLNHKAKNDLLVEFLERLDTDLPGTLYDAVVDMADRVVKSAEEYGADKDNAMKYALPSGKVTLVITLDSNSLETPKISAKAELKRAFGLELMGTKAPLIDLWSDRSGGLKFSDPDQPELGL